jgi:LacI family transcriptional regulator, repressor for deo operon, udp, cdd, tsx, nupC, and nupG
VSDRGPTGWEVAREAGVSQSTVSLVLSGRAAGRVAPATQERVRTAALRLGYRPHAAARSLRSGRSGLVVLMVPQVRNPLNPFFPRVMDGAEQAAYEHGYSLVLAFGRRGPILEVAAAVDGIIACSQPLPELEGPGRLPAVLLDYTASREVPSVRMDVAGGMAAAVRHLADLGHTRIGHVRSLFATPTFRARARAFRRATARLDTASVSADLSAPAAEEAVRELLAGGGRPTAIVCDDDLQAAGVYRAAQRQGLRIPEQLSVVSFGNTDVATMLYPSLTTVDLPGERLGRAGMTLLLEQLAGGAPRTRSTLPARLQVRDSTAPPP